MGFSGTGLLVFIDVKDDRKSREILVYRAMLSAQIHSNAARLIEQHIPV